MNELRVDIPRYSLYTPYPGTPLFTRLLAEDRILSFNWDDYDTMHVVIQPAQMTPEELYEGFKWAYRETFRWDISVRRTGGPALDLRRQLRRQPDLPDLRRAPLPRGALRAPYSLETPGVAPDPALYSCPEGEPEAA